MPEKLTRVQQYKLRKQKEKKRKQKIALLLLSIVLIALAVITLASTTAVEYREEQYIVCSGDTLWQLYNENCTGVRWDVWLREMLDINGMDNNTHLVPGNEIILLATE